MNNDFRTLFANATDEFLRGWTDPKMVDRAYGYLDKIGRVAYAGGYGCITLVHGTDDYYTRVFIGEDGGLESRCSCPVGHRCKHAVATILTIAKAIREGAGITENAGDCDILKSADRAFAAREAIFEERERKLRERRLAKEKKIADRLGRIPKDEMSYHETLYDVHGARDAFKRAGRHGDAADVCARYCDETCEWAAAADMLSALGRLDDAKAVLRRGMKGTRLGDGSYEDFALLCEKYADVLSAEGNHAFATTVRAATFLFRSGGYSGKRTIELFDAVLDEAAKANAKEVVKTALLRILKTGVVPEGLATRDVGIWSWRRPDVPVASAPPWPLPPLPKEWELGLSESLWDRKEGFLADQELVKAIEKGMRVGACS